MLRRLEEIEKKYLHIEEILSQPDISPTEIHRYSKQRSEIIEIVETYREYKQTLEEIEKNRTLLADPELGELAKEELGELLQRRSILQEQLRELMLPKDPNDSKNVFLEIRAGTGGEEAALFASDLFRMYSRFAERTGWRVEVMNINETEIGGIKEVIAAIEGSSVYGKLKYESGVHRVQRIPSTEAGGRIHTSTSTVVVIPEPDEMDELDIDERDLRIDTYRASGPGGQHVNKTDSAVRVTHLPTGIVVQCQDERSQHKNRSKCMRMLRAKLFELEEEKRQSEISDLRRSHVGSGDRSEKIRTYNFPQGRITDHRIGLTLHKIEAILDGDLEEITQALNSHYKAKVMNQAPES
ncbi:MAG: peptide chain release factor 1 [Candidatus Dadabacteria bacterium]|nr:peptide chain release factor 1 [Candidatus Dadabacteria bacterium]